ncbi:hypothetical protein, partial [Pseudomaricurvus sp.]|uniref:hypothetical protein n=1 Tax=Pseudomaricurvus sp. TaxID=2004510 RepID=UPI003F6BA599
MKKLLSRLPLVVAVSTGFFVSLGLSGCDSTETPIEGVESQHGSKTVTLAKLNNKIKDLDGY